MKRTITLEYVQKTMRARNPIEAGRHTQGCCWYLRGINLFHERTYFPRSPFKEVKSEFWTNPVYTSRSVAENDAARFGGKVQECFYCDPDNPNWFVSFNDIDKAIKHWMHFVNRA